MKSKLLNNVSVHRFKEGPQVKTDAQLLIKAKWISMTFSLSNDLNKGRSHGRTDN